MHTDRLLAATLALTLAQGLSAQTHVYVDDDAPSGGDGLSWQSAFTDLHEAIELARTLGQNRGEIRIAGGTYRPDQGTLVTSRAFVIPIPNLSEEGPFSLKGGYAGLANGIDPDFRDTLAFPTSLDADLLGNDTADPGSRSDNSHEIVLFGEVGAESTGTLSAIVLDGIGFRGAKVGAVRGMVSAITIGFTDCRFTENRGQGGSAIGLVSSYVTIRGCSFVSNSSTVDLNRYAGGAVSMEDCVATIEDSSFSLNTTTTPGAGAIWSEDGSLSVEECEFFANFAGYGGGAIGANQSQLIVARSGFTANRTGLFGCGGAILLAQPLGQASVYQSSFGFNEADLDGGAISGPVEIIESEFVSNSAGRNGGAIAHATVVRDSVIADNTASAGQGGGLYAVEQIIRSDVTGNNANRGAGIANAALIDTVLISGNNSFNSGAGLWLGGSGDTVMRNSVFLNNRLSNRLSDGEDLTKDSTGRLDIMRTTFVQTGPNPRTMLTLTEGETWIESSIVWATQANAPQIRIDDDAPTAFVHCNILGGEAGTIPFNAQSAFFLGGNINADPKFVGPAGGNVRLLPGSPCIDAGYLFTSGSLGIDVYGGSRSAFNDQGMPNIGQGAGGALDIGATEFRGRSCFADLNADGSLTAADFSAWIATYNAGGSSADQNRDGDLTVADFSAWIANYNNGCP